MNHPFANKILKVCTINGIISSSITGMYVGYDMQKDFPSIPNKIISASFGIMVGAMVGYPVGVALTLTSPIMVPMLIYDYYDKNITPKK